MVAMTAIQTVVKQTSTSTDRQRTNSPALFSIENLRKFLKMSDKKKNMAAPTVSSAKTSKVKRPSTVTIASSSTTRPKTVLQSKEKVTQAPRSKFNKNSTVIGGETDTTIISKESLPSFDVEYRQIAYGNFLRAMLEECLVDEKIEREETLIDVQMAQLANRFQETTDLLDKTNKRLKDVSFAVEQKRLLDMKSQDCSRFYETTDNSNAQDILQNLSNTQQVNLDKLATNHIDFGFNKNSGHQQLLDAVNDAIDGLDQIKKHSKLDIDKFKEYENSQTTWSELEKQRFDLEELKRNFDTDFPKFNEKLLKEASEKIARMIDNDGNDEHIDS